MNQSIDQQRATHAYKAVEVAKTLKEDEKKKYGVHARKLPMRIIASGLGQALAFLVAKNYCPSLLKALSHWCDLSRKDPPREYPSDSKTLPEPNELLLKIIQGNSEELRRYTGEALAYLQWLVRFVEAAKLSGEE